ncbi:MAG: TIGR00159 family protein [Microscillaceae bacterium]|nr:TIGR00159 family protein [Microscillaceae bacterium]
MTILLFQVGFLEISWVDIADILLVSLLIYQVYQLVKGSVAVRILLGGLSILMLWLVVRALHMELLSTILGQFIGVGVIAALILFQQEIRKFLLVLGKANYLNNSRFWQGLWGGSAVKSQVDADVFVEAAREMAASLTGALIVFTKSSELKFYADSGDAIDALASKRLIISIFNKYSPMHDGAMIIGREGRIKAARCILPVSENDEIPASLGLRHRAAIGVTEVTDAVVVVVSEETGHISIVKNGEIFRNLSPPKLKEKLSFFLTLKEDRAEEDTLDPLAEGLTRPNLS